MCLRIDTLECCFPSAAPREGKTGGQGRTEPPSSPERLNRRWHCPAHRVPELGQRWESQEF